MAHLAVWLSGLGLMVLFSLSASIALADDPKNNPTTQPSPDPGLSPRAVVKIVVDALGKNDANNTGIKTTWKFASPGNQQATGPIEQFIPMVKSPQYQPLLNSTSAEIRELSKQDGSAAELAIITAADGSKAYYIFQMTRQADGDVKDCWMTDGVVRVEPKEQPQPRAKPSDGSQPV